MGMNFSVLIFKLLLSYVARFQKLPLSFKEKY